MGAPWAIPGGRMCEVPRPVPCRTSLHEVVALAWLLFIQGTGDDAVLPAVGDLPVFDVRTYGTCWPALYYSFAAFLDYPKYLLVFNL